MNGRFITIEGGEGAGKSTQIRLLMAAFHAAGLPVIHTREPGGTDGAEQIRELLLKGDADKWDSVAETLLFYAARKQHLSQLVWPAMQDGKHVICDRFADSTRVYQGYAKGLGDAYVQAIHHLTLGAFEPDLTLWLDIDTQKGLQRATGRVGETELRFENMHHSFHDNVWHGFNDLHHANPNRMVRIDANAGIEAVHRQIITLLSERLGILLKPQPDAV
jgi:dTMP kinase